MEENFKSQGAKLQSLNDTVNMVKREQIRRHGQSLFG